MRSIRRKLPSWRDIDVATLKVGGTKKKLASFTDADAVDVIVIGSGLGGLATAVILSKVGYKVLVLEQQVERLTHSSLKTGLSLTYLGRSTLYRWQA